MKSIYTKATKEEAVRRYQQGDKLAVIATELDIQSKTTIYGWLNKAKTPLKHPINHPHPKPKMLSVEPTWEQTKAAVLLAFELASKVPALEEENNRLKNVVATLRNELACLMESNSKAVNEEERYSLAIQQGEVNPL